MKFVELTIQEYDTFARKHACRNYLNSANAFRLKEENGWQCCFVGVKENEEIIAATGICFVTMMKKYVYAYAQRGFLIDYKNKELLSFFTKELISYLKNKKAVYLKIDPYVLYQQRDNNGDIVEDGFNNKEIVENLKSLGFIHQGFSVGFSSDSQCRFMMTLDLEGKTKEQVLKEMDQQTRWSVNKANKLGVQVKTLKEEEMHIFKEMMDDTAKRRHFEDMSMDTYYKQRKMFGEENAQFYFSYIDVDMFFENIEKDRVNEQANMDEINAVLKETPNSKKFIKKQRVSQEALDLIDKREKEAQEMKDTYGSIVPLAVAYFVTYEDEVVYVSSGSNAAMKKYNGPYAIQWKKICESIDASIKRYNFYGTTGDFTKEAEDYGVFEFKKGFNAVAEELIGDFILPIQPSVYKRYLFLQKVKKKIKG